MFFKTSAFCLAFLLSLAPASFAQGVQPAAPQEQAAFIEPDPSIIGHIAEIEGDVTLTSAGKTVPATLETPVRLNDIVGTGKDARAAVLFIDDTQVILSGDTQLTVDRYVFDSENTAGNAAVYSFLRGAFYYASGLMTKKKDPDVTINVPNGSIGIRGTRLWGGEDDGEYGVMVDEGMIKVRTEGGESFVSKGLGTSLRDRRLPPGAPRVWRPEKAERLKARLAFRDPDAVKKRLAERQVRQGRERQEIIKRRKEGILNRQGQKNPSPAEQPRKPLKERYENLKEKIQEGTHKGAQPIRERYREMKENLKEKLHHRDAQQQVLPEKSGKPPGERRQEKAP